MVNIYMILQVTVNDYWNDYGKRYKYIGSKTKQECGQ